MQGQAQRPAPGAREEARARLRLRGQQPRGPPRAAPGPGPRPAAPPHLQPVLALAELAVRPRGAAPVLHGLEGPREGDAARPEPLQGAGAVQLRVHLARPPEAVLRLGSATWTEAIRAAAGGRAGGPRKVPETPGPGTGLAEPREGAQAAWARATPALDLHPEGQAGLAPPGAHPPHGAAGTKRRPAQQGGLLEVSCRAQGHTESQ